MINYNPLKNLFYDNNQKKFLKFIKKIFNKSKFKSQNSVLVENVDNKIHHIPYVYLLNFLVKNFKAKIFIYNPNQLISFKRILYNLLVKFKKPFFYKILNIFFEVNFLNNSNIILINKNEKKLLNKIKKKLKVKKICLILK